MTRKEKIYAYICHDGYKPLTKQELCITLDVPKSDYGAFNAIIGELLSEGKLAQNKKGRLRKAGAPKAVYGTLRMTKGGNAFVVPLEAEEAGAQEKEEDIFIDRKGLGYALDGDTVAVKITRDKPAKRKSKEGVVTKDNPARNRGDNRHRPQAGRQAHLYPGQHAEPDSRHHTRERAGT